MYMISIIVPVYNSEKTLCRCIDSILSQTFKNWELLLINDGSKDVSGNICDEYALKDKRIKVFHKENGGVSSARNVGLENAKGDWITFIDSDDWVKEDYLSNLFGHTGDGVELVISYAEIIKNDDVIKEVYPSRVVTDNYDLAFVENDLHWHTSPWSKLYIRSIIDNNKLRFNEDMHIGEDAVFLFSYILLSKKIFISSDIDYCYNYSSEDSLTKRIFPIKSEMASYENISILVGRLIKEKNVKNRIALKDLYWLVAYYQRRILNSLYYNNISRTLRLSLLTKIDWNLYITNIGLSSKKEKMFIFFLRYKMYWVYDFIRFSVFSLKRYTHE